MGYVIVKQPLTAYPTVVYGCFLEGRRSVAPGQVAPAFL